MSCTHTHTVCQKEDSLLASFARTTFIRKLAQFAGQHAGLFMPERKYDLRTARQEFGVIRNLKSKPAQQERAFASFKKRLGLYTKGKQAVCGVPVKGVRSRWKCTEIS